MRYLSLLLALACGIGISPAGRLGPVPPAGSDVAITEANATSTIKISGRPWVDSTQDVWNGVTYTRYNRSRIVDLATWSAPQISFQALCLPATLSTSPADCYVVVVVDGAHYADVAIPAGFMPQQYTIGLDGAAHDVQLWDGWQSRQNNYDASLDGRVSACYVTSVRVPTGQPSPVKLTATLGIVSFGDSTNDGIATEPYSWYGWVAQIRRSAMAHGGLVGYIGTGAGTIYGDGFTPAQFAQMVHDLWAAMGSTNKVFMYVARPNDGAYCNLNQAHPTATEYGADVGTILDDLTASDPGYTAIIGAPYFPQGSGELSYSCGTRAAYQTALEGVASGRSQVTLVDLSAAFNPATDLVEGPVNGVHPNQTGQNGIATIMKAALGLP